MRPKLIFMTLGCEVNNLDGGGGVGADGYTSCSSNLCERGERENKRTNINLIFILFTIPCNLIKLWHKALIRLSIALCDAKNVNNQ